MELRFIGQGYNTNIKTSVARVLIDSLSDNSYNSFKCLVAFASYSGVTGLTKNINNSKKHIKNIRVVVGIDQLGTSKEALEALLDWNVESLIFNTKSSIIFHPKIYIFEGDKNVKIIIGSNNLTQTGLSQNIEGSIEVTFTKDEEQGIRFLEEIITYYDPIFTNSHVNLEPLSIELIKRLVVEGKVPTEIERRSQYSKGASSNDEDQKPVDQKNAIFPSIPIQSLASGFTPEKLGRLYSSTEGGVQSPTSPTLISNGSVLNLSWNFLDTSEVLIAEIGGGGRWTQISFAKDNFINFFELPTTTGSKGQKNLRYIENNGNIDTVDERISSAKVKKSVNFNLEPKRVRESGIVYNNTHKPIIIFIKINSQNFLYQFVNHGSQLYNELNRFLPGSNIPKRLRRTVVTLENLRRNCPSFILNN